MITSGLLGPLWRWSMFLTSLGTLGKKKKKKKQQPPSCSKPPWPLPVTTGLQSRAEEPQKCNVHKPASTPTRPDCRTEDTAIRQGNSTGNKGPGFSGVPAIPGGDWTTGYVNSAQAYQWSGVRAVPAGKSAVTTTPRTPTPSSCQMSLSCPHKS